MDRLERLKANGNKEMRLQDRKILAGKLAGCELFKGLSENVLMKILRASSVKSFEKGSLIFEQGAPADFLYILVEGKVKLFKLSFEGKEQTLHIVRPVNSFADIILFSDAVYPAFAETMDDSTLLLFDKREFLGEIKVNSNLALNIISTLSQRLLRMNRLVEELSLKEVAGRLALYILNSCGSQKDSFVMQESKTQLAAMLGTISETLSRTFTKMRNKKIVEISKNRIKIINRASLEDVAQGILQL